MPILLLILLLASTVLGIYDVPSYFGHFSRNFFLPASLANARFRYF